MLFSKQCWNVTGMILFDEYVKPLILVQNYGLGLQSFRKDHRVCIINTAAP